MIYRIKYRMLYIGYEQVPVSTTRFKALRSLKKLVFVVYLISIKKN